MFWEFSNNSYIWTLNLTCDYGKLRININKIIAMKKLNLGNGAA